MKITERRRIQKRKMMRKNLIIKLSKKFTKERSLSLWNNKQRPLSKKVLRLGTFVMGALSLLMEASSDSIAISAITSASVRNATARISLICTNLRRLRSLSNKSHRPTILSWLRKLTCFATAAKIAYLTYLRESSFAKLAQEILTKETLFTSVWNVKLPANMNISWKS